MREGREERMNRKTIIRLFHLSALLILPLASCRGGETPPIPQMPTGTYTNMNMPLFSPTPATSSPTPNFIVTDTGTLTPTTKPADYVLKDWREPAEVITPENMERVERIGRLEFNGELLRFAWSPDGLKLGVSVYSRNTEPDISARKTFIVNANTFEEVDLHIEGYGYIAFSYDGKLLETGGSQYDLETGEEISHGVGTITYFPGKIMDIEFSPNGEFIAAAGTEIVNLYPMGGDYQHHAFTREGAEPMHASVSPDSRIIAVDYSHEGFVELWDPYSVKPIRMLKLKGMGSGGKPRFYRDTNSLFLIGWSSSGEPTSFIQEWDYRNGKPLSITQLPEIHLAGDMILDISPISGAIVYLSDYGNIFLNAIHSCQFVPIGKVGGKLSKPGRISFRPDGMLFATKGWDDNAIELWGIPSSPSNNGNDSATDVPTVENQPCPKIPMIVEQPVPKHDWWGQ
jgi:WD40 repeat protein